MLLQLSKQSSKPSAKKGGTDLRSRTSRSSWKLCSGSQGDGPGEQIAAELEASLAGVREENAALVEQIEEVVMITLDDEVVFVSSSVIVREDVVPTLQAIAGVIRQHPTWDVYVQGHTDDKKILEEFQDQWPTNWEMASDRACAITRYLTNELDLPAERFAAVSYGPFQPIGDNETASGRSENRRVTIVLHKPEF